MPDSTKSDNPKPTPRTSLLDHALAALAKGYAVFPCLPRTKEPATMHGFHDASRDPEQIRKWWAENPNYNPAISCGGTHGGGDDCAKQVAVVDGDNFADAAAVEAWRDRNGIPATYTVRTGRRDAYGAQLYFAGLIPTFEFELDGVHGHVKGLGGYVMAAGSVHPTGELYVVTADLPLATFPAGALARKRTAVSKPVKGEKIGKNRNIWLTSQAGRLVNAGLAGRVLLDALRGLNGEYCRPPLPDEEVAMVAGSADRNFTPESEARRDETLADVVAEFNSRFFVLENLGNKCRVAWQAPDPHPDMKGRLVLGHQSFADFSKRFMNQRIETSGKKGPALVDKGTLWLEHPGRRQYETVAFAPGKDLGPHVLNLWRGFAFEPRPGDCSLYLEHVRNVISKGNPVLCDYVVKWLARGVQRPGERAHTALVVRGEKGAGKNFFADAYGSLWGAHSLAVANAEHIVGRFNSHLRDTCVLIANEAFYAGNRQHEAVLKMLVTDTTLPIEQKYIDLVTVPNLLRLIILSNSEWVVPASFAERRFLVLDAGDDKVGDLAYFRAIEAQLNAGGYEALLHHLLYLDLTGFDPRAVPKTEGLRMQMSESLTGVEAVWYECLHRGEAPGRIKSDGSVTLTGAELIEWADKRRGRRWEGIRSEHVGHLFGSNPRAREDRRGMAFRKNESKAGERRRQAWFIPPLAEARKRWNERRFTVDWDVSGREVWVYPTDPVSQSDEETSF